MSSHPATPASSSSAQKKRTRRVLQACENCRRKKTRCPGERPRCSTCSRLGQSCRYPVLDSHGEDTLGQQLGHSPVVPGGDGFGQGLYIRRLEDRLARLEAKLDARSDGGQDKTADGSRSSEPPRRADSTQPDHDDGSGRPSSTPLVAAAPGSPSRAASPAISSHIKTGTPLLPSRRVIAEAIRVYFRCSHRQPVWLFEPKSSLSVSSSHAVLLCVLALSTQHSPEVFAALGDEAPLKSPGEYNDAARRAILQSIGNAAVDLATLQALCLLSFSNLVRGDVQLASFHVSLASNLMHCAGLDTHRSTDRTLALENERRLYWSVQMVAALCGAPLKIPSTYSISAPSFVLPVETNATARRNTADTQPAPLLPLDPPSIGIRRPPGNSSTAAATADRAVSPNITSIWLHMVRSASLWGLVRAYLWRCHHEQQRPSASLQSGQDQRAPWHPDADYTAIHAQLFDMEGAFPVSFRYDASRFMERPLDELLRHRDFWLPWMKIQVTYHTIHAVLNHPFLYSPRVSQARPGGPNSFWKTSTDLALLHSTWIARILGMAHKKGLPLADPFFVYAASVAITLHVYWSRASDPSIRTAAEKYIDVCRAFIADLAVHWPLCKNMEHDVEQLMELSAVSRPRPENTTNTASAQQHAPPTSTTTLADNVSLIWRILDFAGYQQPNAPMGQSLFQPSLQESLRLQAASPQPMDLEDPPMESPPKDFQTSTGDYAGPPDWFTPPDMPDATTEAAAAATTAAGAAAPPPPPPPPPPEATSTPMELPVTTGGPIDVQTVHAVAHAAHTGHAHGIDEMSVWTTWETAQPQPPDAAPSMIFDPFGQLFLSRNAPDYSRWWDGGNL